MFGRLLGWLNPRSSSTEHLKKVFFKKSREFQQIAGISTGWGQKIFSTTNSLNFLAGEKGV